MTGYTKFVISYVEKESKDVEKPCPFFVRKRSKDMAKATYRQKIDGLVVNVGDDIPEMGSLRFVSGGHGAVAEIEGNIADVSLLPTDVKQGSQAYFVDTQDVYKYDESTTQWIEQ